MPRFVYFFQCLHVAAICAHKRLDKSWVATCPDEQGPTGSVGVFGFSVVGFQQIDYALFGLAPPLKEKRSSVWGNWNCVLVNRPELGAGCSRRRTTPPMTSTPPAVTERESPMDLDLDLDLDGPWSFEQILFSNPTSPLSLPFIEQPSTNFYGNNEHGAAGNDESTIAGGNPDWATENPAENDEERRLPLSFLGLTPVDYSDWSCVIKERMTQALRYFKESTGQHVLAQVWSPLKNGGRYVLTTSGQPFVLDPNSNGLHQYRMISLRYMFCADGDIDGFLGLPGRVFLQKLPEWSPDVQYYSTKEYPRLNHALNNNVHGTLGLPVFEQSGRCCVGVIELILTSPKINYAPEVEKVCKALEAVDLKSSEILDHPNTQIYNEGRQKVLGEILEILTVACETHKLPLAQTWIPCRHHNVLAYGPGSKKICSGSDGTCMSTSDAAFYVVDAHVWGFREACAEHHLQKGQGVAGQAFSSQNLCFHEDITQFCKTEYPLVHYARMFGLVSSFAICLRSSHTGNDEYILEFFLPPDISDSKEQQTLLDSLLVTMKQHFHSLRVASGRELEDEGKCVEIIKSLVHEKLDSGLGSIGTDTLPNGPKMTHIDSLKQQVRVEVDPTNAENTIGEAVGIESAVSVPEHKDASKKLERKRGKGENSITLEVLQQYFAGSLKDAAKSLGVCPTTMKRICRQHGISRWPSRKIKKVNHSLSKLKRVIESVHGAEGAFTLTSLAAKINDSSNQNLAGSKPSELVRKKNERMTPKIPGIQEETEAGNQMVEDSALGMEVACEQNGFCPEFGERLEQFKTERGSRAESCGTATSRGSCQGSAGNECSPQADQVVSPLQEKNIISDKSCSEEVPREAMAVLANDVKTVTMKATYKGDMIRFRLPSHSGILNLKEEVAKRLKLEMGTFHIKYLDDDHEWVLIACDADLHECVDMLESSGSNIIRLSIHDTTASPGSSCESSGE
ncbi:hypothetical protein NMG60_11030580 [Bertholletia excelsa]